MMILEEVLCEHFGKSIVCKQRINHAPDPCNQQLASNDNKPLSNKCM